MKNVLWFLVGVIGGFVFAHFVNKDPRGHELLAEVDARIGEFTDRIGDAYREQEARFAGVIDAARDAAAEVVDSATGAIDIAKTAAGDAFSAAKDVASDAVASAKDVHPTPSKRRRMRHPEPSTPPRTPPSPPTDPRRRSPSAGRGVVACPRGTHTYEDRRDLSALSRLLREERAHDRALRIARHRRPGAAVHGGRHGAVHPVPERRCPGAVLDAPPTTRSASARTTSKRSARPLVTARSSRCSATGRSATTSRRTRSASRGAC